MGQRIEAKERGICREKRKTIILDMFGAFRENYKQIFVKLLKNSRKLI